MEVTIASFTLLANSVNLCMICYAIYLRRKKEIAKSSSVEGAPLVKDEMSKKTD